MDLFPTNFVTIFKMELGKFVEEKIREAIKAGEFDNLKGRR